MTTEALPLKRYSADLHVEALNNLVERYKRMEEPVHYREAALDSMNETTCSSCLRFFKDVSILETEKQGVYIPTEEVLQYANTDFDPESEAYEGLRSQLEDNEIFKEASFFLQRESYENEELAEAIIGQEEDLSGEEKPRVITFIEIMEQLNLLRGSDGTSEEGELDESSDSNEEADVEEKVDTQEQNIVSGSASEEVEFEELPVRGDVESLFGLIELLKQGGSWDRSDIEEELDIGQTKLRGTIDLGMMLGMIKESDEGYVLSDDGYNLAFEGELNEASRSLFKKGIQSDTPYVAILDAILTRKGGEIDETIENTDVLQILRTEFSLREPKENRIKRATTVMFKCLEGAGYGEYKPASGEYPTRFKISESYSLPSVVDELLPDIDDTTDQEPEPESHEEDDEAGDVEEAEVFIDKDEPVQSSAKSESSVSVDSEESNESDEFSETLDRSTGNTTINIDIEVDLGEVDSAELESKLDVLQQYLLSD